MASGSSSPRRLRLTGDRPVKTGGKTGMAKRLAWVALRAEFVRRRLDGEAISLEQFAKSKGVHPRTVEKRASKEAWFDEIDNRARERVQAVDDHSRRLVEQLRFYVNRDEMATRR